MTQLDGANCRSAARIPRIADQSQSQQTLQLAEPETGTRVLLTCQCLSLCSFYDSASSLGWIHFSAPQQTCQNRIYAVHRLEVYPERCALAAQVNDRDGDFVHPCDDHFQLKRMRCLLDEFFGFVS